MIRSKQITFFATRSDITIVMEKIELEFEIEYIEMGIFDTIEHFRYSSIKDISSIGTTNYGNWISLDNRFMIVNKNMNVNFREVIQQKGGTRYAVDPMLNLKSVELSTGGIYAKKNDVLIAGRLATVNDNDFSTPLYKAILAVIKKESKKVNTVFIGHEAEKKWKDGWRLVTSETSASVYDIT
ncbi:hypothetical protein SAMN05216436_12145 [bacterium A37T11]|nr:hypothetical protein SAMN05216436_12145 [bacterium A37T11]